MSGLAADPGGVLPFRWANVVDGNAIAIALTGMMLVFAALTLISVFIAALPKILRAIEPFLPAFEDHDGAHAMPEGLESDEERTVAAIAHVLYTEMPHMLKQ